MEFKKLVEYVSFSKGNAFKSKSMSFDNEVPVVKVRNFTDYSLDIKSCEKLPYDYLQEYKKFELFSKDILISSVGSWATNPNSVVGKVVRVPKITERLLLNQNIVKISSKKNDLLNSYLFWLLKGDDFKNFIVSNAQGSANQASVTLKSIGDYEFILPDLKKQLKISTMLDKLQNKIELNNQMIDTLEEMASTLFKRWFVDFEFPDENGNPYKSSGGKMIDSELGEIPEGWEAKKIKSVVTITRGASPRPIKDFIQSEGRPWIKISDANATSSPYIYDTKEFIKQEGVSKSRTVESDTLILSNSATPGIPKIVKILSSVHDGWLIFNNFNELSKEFLYLFLIEYKKKLLSLSNGSVFRNLKTDILKEFLIVSPKKEEFERFQIVVLELFSNIDTLALEIIALEDLRDEVLPKLLSGELEV